MSVASVAFTPHPLSVSLVLTLNQNSRSWVFLQQNSSFALQSILLFFSNLRLKWEKQVVKNPPKIVSHRSRVEWWLPGAGKRRNEELVFNGYRCLQDEKNSGDGWWWRWYNNLVPLNCTLENG